MKRKLKFRVWDTESKCFRTGDWCLRIESNLVTGKYGEEFPEFIVQQFTGFQDKNGMDIYEADILSDYTQTDEGVIQSKMQVFWCDTIGAWKLDNSYNQDKSNGDLLSDELHDFKYEITGNIFQIKEL